MEFSVKEYEPDWGQWHGVVPIVDGVSLLTRIRDYETANLFDIAGSYAGIEPSSKSPERWVRYLLGEANPEDVESSNGTTWLLGCGCSVAGCWPLEVFVAVERDTVTWDGFRQPHRPERNYSRLGPFVFARDEYEQAVVSLAANLATGSAQR
jgi:hypothetical protein